MTKGGGKHWMNKKEAILQSGTSTIRQDHLKELHSGYMMKWTGLGKKGGFLLWESYGKSLHVLVVMVPGTSLSDMIPRGIIG